MPAFAYTALDARGKETKGGKEAENSRVLRLALRKEGLFVTETHEARDKVVKGKGLSREFHLKEHFDRVRPQDVAVLTRQLATLLRAGIPLSECLQALVEQTTSQTLRQTLSDVRTKVNEGTALGDALAAHKKHFSDLYVNMVRAGEAAGNLEQVLARLAIFMDGQVRLKGKVTSALVYPIVMAIVGIGITGMLMVVVVPKVTQIFADMGKALPWNTRLLIWTSHLAASYWWLMILLGVGGYFFFGWWKKTEGGRSRLDRFYLRLWVVGPLVRMVAISRFARTMGTMLEAGVPLLRTLEIVRSILGNTVLMKIVDRAGEAIREGGSIAEPLAASGQFPPIVTRMIAVGERSGQLEAMLENVADAYETEVDLRIQRLTTLMEPLIILLMGGVVGFIVMSILLPILDMNEMVG
ncbi:MAG: type II secretion system inner membrane protein GspF [Deltaproteobacteria bacterium]|nr:type II secretion system inner membrane protein GspF [Deltaproteobacteria bacterium]